MTCGNAFQGFEDLPVGIAGSFFHLSLESEKELSNGFKGRKPKSLIDAILLSLMLMKLKGMKSIA
jgi:hypothetical protein